MKKYSILFFLLTSILYAQTNIYFTSDPALSPDAKTIIFSYENDLWTVPAQGGLALRLTGMEGEESDPVFSPDGKWIAFTGRQDGNPNIYVMPGFGGEIKQLTFNDKFDVVESWSWDSKSIYFTSTRYNRGTVFKINREGGTPYRLFENYFNIPHNFVEHPLTGEYLFNESWESSLFAHRKRYKGDFNPDIKSYNPNTKEFKVLTTYRGKDMFPSIDKNGNIYFISDEFNNEYNLYTFENGNKKQLTSFESSIKRPKVNAGGDKIVFEKDYQIFIYDVASQSTNKVEIKLAELNTLSINKDFNSDGKITSFNVSNDNKKIAFISRGKLFVSDIDGKFIKELDINSKERAVDVYWLKDNKTLLFSQTVKGRENLFTIAADGSGKAKQITSDDRNNRAITINQERTKGLYYSGRDQLRTIDLSTFKSEIIVTDEFWAMGQSPAYFSPDEKYVLYTAYRNFEHEIFVYDVEKKESFNITKTGVSETLPYWSPDGKYIYFQSDRLKPSYPWGWDNMNIYRVALKKYDTEFKADKFKKLFNEDEKKDSSKPAVEFDLEGLNQRWETISEEIGNQSFPYVIQKDEQTTVLFVSNHDSEGSSIWKTVIKPFEKNSTAKIAGTSTESLNIVSAKDDLYALLGGYVYKLDLKNNKSEKIKLNTDFTKNLQDEFEQMFYETWSNIDENFYDGNFHGADWNKLRDYYGSFLPYLKNRDNLRTILLDLEGELNSSHQNFVSTGDEEKTFYKMNTLTAGLIFDNENPYKVERIINKFVLDKVDKKVMPGDILTSVNGVEVDAKINREFYFTFPQKLDELELTFNRNGEKFSVYVHAGNTGDQRDALYDEWMENNQKLVDVKSDNKIAYIHMKNMTPPELERFLIEMSNEWFYREALILDLRNNTGGNVHDQVLQFLSQRPYLQWKYRDGEFTPQPNFSPAVKPIVLLINEQSLSDAEMTATGFKHLKLGKVIGTETYRWIIFTNNVKLVDGSIYRLPSWGCYTLDEINIETNGVSPDIYVKQTFKDRVNGLDPQLDRAIEEILKELSNN